MCSPIKISLNQGLYRWCEVDEAERPIESTFAWLPKIQVARLQTTSNHFTLIKWLDYELEFSDYNG